MTLGTFAVEAGISVGLVFMLFNFSMAMMESSMNITDNMLNDMQNNDFQALEKDMDRMDNYMKGAGSISTSYLENFNFNKDELTEENIQKLKDAIGEYEKTNDTEELRKILEEIEEEQKKKK